MAIHRLDLADGSRLALRRYVWRKYVESEPEAPAQEVDALEFAGANGLPVPEVIAFDPTGEQIGDGIPLVLTTLLPGRPQAVPDLQALAEVAAQIHAVDASGFDHSYQPWYEEQMTTPPPSTQRPDLWERAIELWLSGLPDYRPAFIHRDLHPGNLLWSRGRLTGIVDWAAACNGPTGCDIAHCRSNLIELDGIETAEAFVAAYEAITEIELDPFWVMAGQLEHDHSHWTPARLERAEAALERALRHRL